MSRALVVRCVYTPLPAVTAMTTATAVLVIATTPSENGNGGATHDPVTIVVEVPKALIDVAVEVSSLLFILCRLGRFI